MFSVQYPSQVWLNTNWGLRRLTDALREARRLRLTLLFVVVSVAVIAAAAIIVNHVVGDLAEDNLIRIAEENTTREAAHIQKMMRMMGPMGGAHAMQSMPSGGATDNGNVTQHMQQPTPMTLEFLASSQGLPSNYPMLVEGLNLVKLILFDTNGFAVWSTDLENLDTTKPKRKGSNYWKANRGEVASKFVLGEKSQI